ncbi:MAG: 3-dehydroquinate synthase [Dehalococcoidia bacterium]|nr:3-dehydroquinate synthase [Dehalococcoidia bacterium]MDD5493218.1 3-dehydroquinate synthase [Dehalococcoidia bacterium]
MRKLKLKLGSNSYEIIIGWDLLQQMARLLDVAGLRHDVVIITNPVVEQHYGNSLNQNLLQEGFKFSTLLVPDGEAQKTLKTAEQLYSRLADLHVERTTSILATGGGVIGDLAGFVAATYMRGLPLVQVPTTLLAQVDSSVGGKVAVDSGTIKNKIGVFYQPRLVLTDTATLQTLPAAEFSNGLAEVIKYAVIVDKLFFAYLEENMQRLRAKEESCLEEVIFRSVKIKAGIVEKDEKDTGLRNILNFGHTVGHAIESASDFKIKHGEAVALGMLAAGKISLRMGLFNEGEFNRMKVLLQMAELPARLPEIPLARVSEAIAHDKKIHNGRIRFVLPKSIGEAFVSDEVSLVLIEEVLSTWHE